MRMEEPRRSRGVPEPGAGKWGLGRDTWRLRNPAPKLPGAQMDHSQDDME